MTSTPDLSIPAPVARLWGCGSLEPVFHGAPITTLPWPPVPRRKHALRVAPDLVEAVLAGPPHLVDLDPRRLFATQRSVVHQHAAYYLTGEWERTGRTSADQASIANRYPLVVVDRGRPVIVGGHHRALAALVEGRPVRARVAPAGPVTARAVTPRLFVGAGLSLPHTDATDPAAAAEAITAGLTVLVPHADQVAAVLDRLGLTPAEVADRLAIARL